MLLITCMDKNTILSEPNNMLIMENKSTATDEIFERVELEVQTLNLTEF